MLTLEEILTDASESPAFQNLEEVGINSQGDNGETPLHWMASLGDTEGIKILVGAGAFIDAKDNKGNTPLHESSVCRQVAASKILLELGANPGIQNNEKMTPKDIATADNYIPMVELLESIDQ